jgi:N-methylhydantoinase A/oxoprolinase/acetone carboxylase beta subunit
MVDVNSIGSGGGSIAWLDGAGTLRVGPHSAGSEPGPACYGQGGIYATVTDASLVLGYINPDYFAGGSLTLDPELARKVINENIAEPLGLSLEAAALGIHRVVNTQMVEGIRLVSIRQGLDPRDFVLVALGGAGPVHATALAQELRIKTVVIPRYPGVLAAAGLLAAPVEHEVSAAFEASLEQVQLESIRRALKDLDSRCAALMAQEGARSEDIQIQYFADLWYVGQSYYLEVALHLEGTEPFRRLYRDFLALHDRIYGYSTEAPVAFVNLRVVHRVGGRETLSETSYMASSGEPSKPPRRIALAGGSATAEVYEREALSPGFLIEGPAIIEQLDSTTVVEQGWRGRVAENGNFILDHKGSTGENNA